MIGKWKTIASKYIWQRPWLTARCDTVQLPSGTIFDEFYVLEYPTWVNIIAITEQGDFVMVEQYRHGLQGVFTELVAGVVEPGENPLDAAKRELLEESGYGGGEWELLTTLCANPSCNTNLTYSFVARGVRRMSEQHLDATEDIEVKLMTRNEVLQMLQRDEMKQALMAAPLWKLFSES